MRFEIYLSVGGRHFDAESFSVQADIPGSCTKEIGRRGAEVCPNLISRFQVWETPRVTASNHPGDDVKALLLHYKRLNPLIAKEDRSTVACWVTIVGYYDEGEEPRGFSFDHETIGLLNQFGASLEIDAGHDLSKPA